MKKLISLALIISLLSCNFSALAQIDNSAACKEQQQSTVQKDFEKKPILNKSGNILKKVLVTGGVLAAALAFYGAYKVSDEIGLNKKIKSLAGYIRKNITLKTMLIGGAVATVTSAAIMTACLVAYRRELERFCLFGLLILGMGISG